MVGSGEQGWDQEPSSKAALGSSVKGLTSASPRSKWQSKPKHNQDGDCHEGNQPEWRGQDTAGPGTQL